jgi:TolB-like protein
MKRFFFECVFSFLTIMIFGQIPGVVVSDFTVRARDVTGDEAVIVTEMLISALAATKKVTVVDRSVLANHTAAVEFESADWSDDSKTARLGAALNADFLVIGTLTQLGTSITFNITVRDIKTLAVITSDQRQYTAGNIWDSNSLPGYIPNLANSLSTGISTEYIRRQRELQAQLAQEEERRFQETSTLAGVWESGYPVKPPVDGTVDMRNESMHYSRLVFRDDGTFTGRMDGRTDSWSDRNNDVINDYTSRDYSGSYIRNGNTLTLRWNVNTTNKRVVSDSRGTRTPVNNSSSSAGNGTGTIRFLRNRDGALIGLKLDGSFGGEYAKK